MGNLTPAVLTDHDSYPIAAEKVAEAVKSLVDDNPPAMAVVFAQPREALPLLRDAYAAGTGKNRLTYAVVLATLGDRTGLAALLDHVRRTPQWDRGWNYKGMGQFGNAMSPLDIQIVALGRAGDRSAVPAILEKLRLLSAKSEFSHHRAVGLALELLGDPAAAGPLAELLAQPGMSGHVQTTIQAGHPAGNAGGHQCRADPPRVGAGIAAGAGLVSLRRSSTAWDVRSSRPTPTICGGTWPATAKAVLEKKE